MERKHELFLIQLGLKTLLEQMVPAKPSKGKTVKTSKRKWTKEQHEKYAATMEKKWGQKRSKKP